MRPREAESLDEPEPRFAMLGPPAITRRMFELWRADPRLMASFDLKEPLHRRDYALWLSREGRSLGCDRQSVAAAVALAERGTSLRYYAPPWPAQAAMPMARRDAKVDAWLAEPIVWGPGTPAGDIPMPRALALLWELRQDVRLHFANRSRSEIRDYIGWCLTQGIRDKCVAAELIEPGLAGFLDLPDPELERQIPSGGPPLTRLLPIVAPLYDGPFADLLQEFPHAWRARFSVALWACGAMRRRCGWPRSFVDRPLRWLLRNVPAVSDAFVPINNLLLGLWEICPDARARGDLGTHEGRAGLRDWFLAEGARRFELDDVGAPGSNPRSPRSVRKPSVRNPAIKRDLCLVGYADLVSGRAQDLQMSALALRCHGKRWAILDRLSGAITTEDGRAAAAFAEPPGINLVHLNADTAFFDYLLLREKGAAQSYTIGCWAWELAEFPRQWNSSFAFVQEIWAASRFACDAIAPATTKPVLLMPMAVSVPRPEPGVTRAHFGLPEDKFVFHFSFDFRSYTSRKNPLAAVTAFRRAFPNNSAPVVLLLKTIGSEWKSEERDSLLEVVRGDPRILLVDRELSRPRAIALLAMSDCFVSLHRSEGFGRGPAEAMLLGKPVIVTDYSGTRDYATRETALLVGYRLIPVGAEEYPGADGQVWAEPDLDEAAAAMRKIVADPSLVRRLGKAGRARIRKLYHPEVVGARYLDRLAAIARAA